MLVAQSCPILRDPMDCSPPGSFVHGTLQARIREWVAMASSRGFFPTERLHLGLSHCRQALNCLSHQGRPKDNGATKFMLYNSSYFFTEIFPMHLILFSRRTNLNYKFTLSLRTQTYLTILSKITNDRELYHQHKEQCVQNGTESKCKLVIYTTKLRKH